MAKKLIHAGRVTISFRGHVIGHMTGFNPTEDWGLAPQYCIGTIFPYEIPALRYGGTFTTTFFYIDQNKAKEALGIPTGSTTGEARAAISELLTGTGITVTVKDLSGEAVLKIVGAKCGTSNFTFTAAAVIVRNATFHFGAQGPMMETDSASVDKYPIILPQE